MSNRVIKFRAFDKKEGKWLYGYEQLGGFDIKGELILMGEYGSSLPLERFLNDVVIMQWTGLHDKNGVEIWEGDVVRFKVDFPESEFDNGVVRWAAGGYWTSQIETDLEELLSEELEDLEGEVIGNIYQHPELLNR